MDAVEGQQEDTIKAVLQAHRDSIAAALAGDDGEEQGHRLRLAARALASVEDVQLHSRLSIRDEDDANVIPDELDIRHRMYKFTALHEAHSRPPVRRDFPLASLANPRISAESAFALVIHHAPRERQPTPPIRCWAEGFNGKAKLVKKRAHGLRSFRNYRLRLLNACT